MSDLTGEKGSALPSESDTWSSGSSPSERVEQLLKKYKVSRHKLKNY